MILSSHLLIVVAILDLYPRFFMEIMRQPLSVVPTEGEFGILMFKKHMNYCLIMPINKGVQDLISRNISLRDLYRTLILKTLMLKPKRRRESLKPWNTLMMITL